MDQSRGNPVIEMNQNEPNELKRTKMNQMKQDSENPVNQNEPKLTK